MASQMYVPLCSTCMTITFEFVYNVSNRTKNVFSFFTLMLGISSRPLISLDPCGKYSPLPRDHLTGALRGPSSRHWNTTSLSAHNERTQLRYDYRLMWKRFTHVCTMNNKICPKREHASYMRNLTMRTLNICITWRYRNQ